MENINKKIGNYSITRKIGEGGMASVYEGIHEKLGTKVAIKILNPILARNPQLRQRFENEANFMASLSHPNITRVLDIEETEDSIAIIMELLEGEDMGERVKRVGPLSTEEINAIFTQVLNAFDYAHSKGIVHRDIKPANIFINDNHQVKILDFGIAKIFGTGNEMTQTGTQMGTPYYMSPEQVKGDKSIDHRSDIYSLGVTLFYALKGSPPYGSELGSQFDVFNKIVYEPLPELSGDSSLISIVQRACQKDRDNRFQSCQEWLNEMNGKNSSVSPSKHNDAPKLENTKEEKSNAVEPKPIEINNPQNTKKPTRKPLIIASILGAICLLIGLIVLIGGGLSTSKYEGNYKSWDFTTNNIIGVCKLDDIHGRNFCRIIHLDEFTIKIEEFNTNEILQKTILINKKDEKISTISYKSIEGFTYRVRNFQYRDGDLFETSKRYGVNEFLPCKGLLHKFKNDLDVEQIYIGMDDNPAVGPDGYNKIIFELYDDESRWGLVKERSYFNLDGLPVESNEKFHKITYSRDDRGNIIEEAFWGINNNSVKSALGINSIKRVFNELDYEIETEYFGESKEKVKTIYGINREKYEYLNGNLSKLLRYNLLGELVEGDEIKVLDGAAIIKYENDGRGNLISESFFDKNESPIISTMGYFKVVYSYNNFDKKISEKFNGIEEEAVNDFSGIHEYVYKYNENGLLASQYFFDTELVRIMDKTNQVYIINYKYDLEGRTLNRSFWKNESEKMSRWSGIHEYLNKYNDQGQVIEQLSLDENGNLKTESSGGSRSVFEYDNLGQLKNWICFDDSEPVLTNSNAQVSNYHMISYTYDKENKVMLIEYFDANKDPIDARINNTEVVHKIEFVYQGSKIINQKWYTKDSSFPVKSIDCLKNEGMGRYGVGLQMLND